MKKYLSGMLFALVAGAITFPQTSFAAEAWINGAKVKVATATHDVWGNCAVKLTKEAGSLSCSKWVTFDCAGLLSGNSKAAGNRKFSQAQLAYVTQKTVRLLVTDDKKINGVCFASRIDLLP
jgi:hypothetical protein